MNIAITIKQLKYVAMSVSLGFLLIHACMLLLFSRYGVTPMARFNVFSILFYVATFVLIKRDMFRAYTILVYLEVVAHMVLATTCVGLGAGFEVTLIGMSFLAFFAEYLGRSLLIKYVSGLALSLVGMVAYVGTIVWCHGHAAPFPLPSQVKFYLSVAWGIMTFVMTIAFLKLFVLIASESERSMSAQIMHDELTGLPNRYFMTERLKQIEDANELTEHWAAMVDIDDFKQINDTYGHNCGDYVLRTVGRLLNEGRCGATLCRWGGEEFLMVGRIEGDMDARVAELDRLRKTVAEFSFWYEDNRIGLTLTIGVAPYSAGMGVSDWINLADQNLYTGKLAGKNRVVA